MIEGGAPNNFLLMKNDRLIAPFQSTVQKGLPFFNTEKGKSFFTICRAFRKKGIWNEQRPSQIAETDSKKSF